MRSIARACALLLVVAGLPILSAAPAQSAGDAASTVTMNSEFEDYVGEGVDRQWYRDNGVVSFDGREGHVHARVDGGEAGTYFDLDFAAPDGRLLEAGTYEHAQRYPFQSSGRSGLSVSGDGRGCNTSKGRFTVLDVLYSGSDIVRFWAVYEQHCEGLPAALTGEVRYQVPEPDDAVLTVPRAVAFPDRDPGVRARPVPVFLVNTSGAPVTFGTPQISGTGAGSFSVVSSTCTSTVPAGGRCVVYPRFLPTSGGAHEAVLRVPDSTALGAREVLLRGNGSPGVTRWRMISAPGDHIGKGRRYDYAPAQAGIAADGGHNGVTMDVTGSDGYGFRAVFRPARDDLLLPGVTYTGAQRARFADGATGLEVFAGADVYCEHLSGTYTVHEIVVVDGALERFAVTFEQFCDGSSAPLRGSLSYRADADRPVQLSSNAPPPERAAGVTRFAGPDRYSTAVQVSRGSFPGTAEDLVVVTGTDWADALSAGPAAASLDGPVLPVAKDVVPAVVLEEVRRLRPARAWVIGGPGAVGEPVLARLRGLGIVVTRVSGRDRYITAAEVARTFFAGARGAYYASGASYADALGGGAAAARRGWPLLLTARDASPTSTPVVGAERIVLGGPAVISEAVRQLLGARRVAGADRYATAAAVALDAFGTADVGYLATGSSYPDALAAAPAASRDGAPLLLAAKDCVTRATREALVALGVTSRVVLGGTAAVGERAAALQTC